MNYTFARLLQAGLFFYLRSAAGSPSAPWWALDTLDGMNRPFSGAILELKTYGDAPYWMIDMVQRFDLVRIGFCKYFNAMRAEMMFKGRGDLTNKLEYAPMH